MIGTSVMEKQTRTDWSRDDPSVRELWRTTNEAHCTIADAIEEAARAGVPVEIIATTAGVPLREVELILKDAEADEEEVRWA
ncbi:hypothetical protein KIF24_10985 [Micromonospora sp. Llam7]|uniref:hypothetical protein n=1 Tax=Micromonospora tarapacensis TaxID=2835305 RepID=UPI001C83B714|nr:hypothetical protein [Micromonospora tarapacensis]MBX7266504.1 hypothetical protein [Micromonospora tarapacensis]